MEHDRSNEHEGDGDSSPHDRVPCHYCIGFSVYTKAMWAARAMPECRGVEVKASAEREIVEKIKSHAQPPRHEDFSYVGMGLSMYSPKWMEEGKHMQSVRGMAFVVVRVTDEEDLMREMEERKRIKRELQKEQGERGEDDQDIYGLDDDADDATPLVERDMVPVKKPMMPPVIPTPISIDAVVNKAVENAKYSSRAMYNFWARRLDGFGDRYVDSCRRLVTQMEKQATSVPHNVMWLAHKIRDRTFGKGGDDGDHKW